MIGRANREEQGLDRGLGLLSYQAQAVTLSGRERSEPSEPPLPPGVGSPADPERVPEPNSRAELACPVSHQREQMIEKGCLCLMDLGVPPPAVDVLCEVGEAGAGLHVPTCRNKQFF